MWALVLGLALLAVALVVAWLASQVVELQAHVSSLADSVDFLSCQVGQRGSEIFGPPLPVDEPENEIMESEIAKKGADDGPESEKEC